MISFKCYTKDGAKIVDFIEDTKYIGIKFGKILKVLGPLR
jgi:hypothetical protein